MTPEPALLAALDLVYEAFTHYPCPQWIDAASEERAKVENILSNGPLRELKGEQIGPYAGWAMTTVGTAADYKYFLPRILEEAVRNPVWAGTEPPIIAQRLKRAGWRTWPKPEQSVIIAFFQTAWREAVGRHPGLGNCASVWLCGYAALEEDILPLLREWEVRTDSNALLQLAILATELPALVSLDPKEQIFWVGVGPKICAEIVSWLLSPQVSAAFANAESVANDDIWHIRQGESAIAEYAQLVR